MSRKQKKMLARILIAALLMIVLHFVPAKGAARFSQSGAFSGLCCIWYLILSSDTTY